MHNPQKHHFLPVFYLKQWVNPDDGRLVQFSRPYGSKVKPLRVHPDGTGYVRRLYLTDEFHDQPARDFESTFFSPVDSSAADALRMMLVADNAAKLTHKQRHAWSSFIASLLLRMPDDLARIKKYLDQHWGQVRPHLEAEIVARDIDQIIPNFRSVFDEFESKATAGHAINFVTRFITNNRVAMELTKMRWEILRVDHSNFEFMTSDRPVIMSNTLNDPLSNVALPIGPRRLFIASHSSDLIDAARKMSHNQLARTANTSVVEGATAFVYGRTDTQLAFVQSRISVKRNASLVGRILPP